MEATPFSTIESAEEFMHLLHVELERTQQEIESLLTVDVDADQPRREEALRLVLFKLRQLEKHTSASRRLLGDLRSLRTLLLR